MITNCHKTPQELEGLKILFLNYPWNSSSQSWTKAKIEIGVFRAIWILAKFTSAAAIVVLPWLIGVVFAYPAALAGTIGDFSLWFFPYRPLGGPKLTGCHAFNANKFGSRLKWGGVRALSAQTAIDR
jgi:hypothetical protein